MSGIGTVLRTAGRVVAGAWSVVNGGGNDNPDQQENEVALRNRVAAGQRRTDIEDRYPSGRRR